MIDPKTLTPESLYELQSETWSQGAEYENSRIVKLLSEAGFPMALERREGDPAIWNGEKWIELSERGQK